MTGFLNDPACLRDESLAGFVAVHAGLVVADPQGRFVRRRTPKRDRVALVSGGGAGHEPMHVGFVGAGMLDAACPGQVFTAPTPDQILAAVTAVDAGRGVLLVVKNYEGDVMNFAMAAEVMPGPVAVVLVDDDVSIASDAPSGRRGLAGALVVEKILGAAAEQGADLQALGELGARVNARTRSIGVALRPCALPATGEPNFALAPDEMEMGVGIHGEAGRTRLPRAAAGTIAASLAAAVLAELAPRPGEEALVLVNGFGGTPPAELYLVAHGVAAALAKAGVVPTRQLAGTFVTSLDMAGCSLTVAMLDAPMRALWDAPVCTAALRW